MRQERTIQASIFDVFAAHEIGRELKAMSQWLDEYPWLLSLVSGDLRRHGNRETGRHGLPAEAVLRCALLKQYRQLSYEELAFHLEDSASFRAFARLPLAWSPKKSVLHKTISAIGAASWEAINRAVVSSARQHKLEDGAMVRIDSTVTEALMHAPTDSSLLWDAVRVMVRLLKEASTLPGVAPMVWRNHRRLVKKRALAIRHSRGKQQKVKLYRELIAATRATVTALARAVREVAACVTIEAELWRCQVRYYLPLIDRLISQAERRVLFGEAVPAGDKLVSLFETHADIIPGSSPGTKGGRDVHYGHKLNLASGRSGLILDVVAATLRELRHKSLIGDAEELALLASAQRAFFADRNPQTMVSGAGLRAARAAEIAALYLQHRVSLKQRDALALVARLRALPDERNLARSQSWSFNDTPTWARTFPRPEASA